MVVGVNNMIYIYDIYIYIYTHEYEGVSESKDGFTIQRNLLIIGKKQKMQVLSHTFTYFST